MRPWVRVVETDTVPKTYVAPGNIRLALPGGGSEPIGNRLVELPDNEQAALDRDPRSGFVVYAPTGSLAKGQALVTTGGDKTTAMRDLPRRNAQGPRHDARDRFYRHGNYIVRQLYFFQDGERSGPSAALMKNVVQRLDVDDMLAIAAYLSSREQQPPRAFEADFAREDTGRSGDVDRRWCGNSVRTGCGERRQCVSSMSFTQSGPARRTKLARSSMVSMAATGTAVNFNYSDANKNSGIV